MSNTFSQMMIPVTKKETDGKIWCMKTAGVITEFNPFHLGHEYFLSEVKKRSGADYMIAVMSADFVQRGEPAVTDKYIRAKAALLGGCDLVLELPVRYCLSSAGGFAFGAVSILHCLGCVDELWFGSENANPASFTEAAAVLSDETPEFASLLHASLKRGSSYARARYEAVRSAAGEEAAALCEEPNNVLGLEYCIALSRLGSKIKPCTIKRIGSAYNDPGVEGKYPSALSIRNALSAAYENSVAMHAFSLIKYLPSYSADLLLEEPGFLFPDDFSQILKYRLLEEDAKSLSSYLNVSDDLAYRIENMKNEFTSFTGFAQKIKTKNITYSHVSRALACILLRIKQEEAKTDAVNGQVRVLAMKRRAADLLHHIKKHGKVLPISSLNEADPALFKYDAFAASVYESVRSLKYHVPFTEERSRKFIII